MPNRSRDWLAQAERDLEHARESRERGRHEWSCFAAQQAAEKAVMRRTSSNSVVHAWPDRETVDRAVRAWAAVEAPRHERLLALGYFGSYATGRWGFGSDLDLVAVVAEDDEPFERRALAWDLLPLPVPAEILVYGRDEWNALPTRSARFADTLAHETCWVWGSPPGS